MKFGETWARYWPYIKEYKPQFLLVSIGIILNVVSTAASAHIMQPLMDNMFIKKEPGMLYIIPLLLITIYFAKSIGRYLQSVFTNYIGLHIVSRLRENLLEKMVHMDMHFLYVNRSGELISRITYDISQVQYFVSKMLPEFIQETFTVAALIGYVIYLNATLAFWSLIVIPLVVYPLIIITKRLKRLSHRSQEKNADLVTRLTEVFNNTEVIKANATEEYEVNRYKAENNRFFQINMKATYTSEMVSPIMEILAASGLAAVIFVGGQQVYANHMTPGEFTAFLTAVGLVFQPLKRVGAIYSKIQDAQAASERIFHVFDLENNIKDGPKTLHEPIHSINFENVTLNFEDKTALNSINLSINPGETIALVGQSGGGKSSLVNLIQRFYDSTKGTVYINDENIKNFTQESLRHQIAAVSQRVYIFQDTLAANVAYGNTIDYDRVNASLEMADALDFVQSLPEGINTLMQEFGANLSGGQRQRIAIARAIYKHASLLILDEATSALDNETEKRIQKALEEYSKDKITIIIAHRLSTIQHADRILYFENGSIIASGKHNDLLEQSESYRRLAGQFNH